MAYKILAVDYANLLYRCYWATKGNDAPGLSIFKFAQSLYITMRQTQCNNIVLCGESYSMLDRTKFDNTYKKDRKHPEDKDFKVFSNCLKDILHYLGFNIVYYSGYEGDDVIATLCKMSSCNTDQIYIMSADKDMRQLLQTGKIYCVLPLGGNRYIYDATMFYMEHGFSPNRYHIYKAIVGDKSDSIAGIEGMGHVGATKIVTSKYPEEEIAKLEHSKQMQYKHALKLVQLNPTVPDKVFERYFEAITCNTRQFRLAKKTYIRYYGDKFVEGTINEFKKILALPDLRNKTIGIEENDFIHGDWPNNFKTNEKLINYMLFSQKHGAKLILITKKKGEDYNKLVNFCKKIGIVFDCINANIFYNEQESKDRSEYILVDEYLSSLKKGCETCACERKIS